VVRHMLLIKLFDGLVVVWKPYLTQMLRLTLNKYQPTSIEVTICIYKLADDEYFKGAVCRYCLRVPACNLSSCFIMQFYGIMNACAS